MCLAPGISIEKTRPLAPFKNNALFRQSLFKGLSIPTPRLSIWGNHLFAIRTLDWISRASVFQSCLKQANFLICASLFIKLIPLAIAIFYFIS